MKDQDQSFGQGKPSQGSLDPQNAQNSGEFPPLGMQRSVLKNQELNEQERTSLLDGTGSNTQSQKQKKGGYKIDHDRLKQLNSQNKLVNPYGTVSKGVLGKEEMTQKDAQTAFMLKKDYNKGSSEEDDDLDISLEDSEYERIQKQKQDIKISRSLIHRQRQKRDGIMPGELHPFVIDDSFTMGNKIVIKAPEKESGNGIENLGKKSILDMISIPEDYRPYLYWRSLNIFCCLTSSYFYAFMAAFENPSQGSFLSQINIVFEIIFLVSMLIQFLVEYTPPGQLVPVKDISLISMRYLRGEFLKDFIPIIPLQLLTLNNGDERLFFIIKIMRLIKGLQVFDVANIMEIIKKQYQKNLDHIIANRPDLAENTLLDNNNISKLITINNVLRIFKLVLIILNISYFLGFAWFIVCDLSYRFNMDYLANADPVYINTDTFITSYDLNSQTDGRKAIIVVYYAFTSLSTVGFGDFYPKSDFERVLVAIILLFGVAIFSYIMGNFINILDQYQNLNSDLDEGDELARFFGLIRRFNENVPLKISLKEQIERHFDYKWINDKNQAIDDEAEREMLEQLPVEVINKIYGDFLFSDFCKIFQRFFRIPKDYDIAFKNPGYHDYYDWSDQEYRFFMLQLLQYLEPRQEDAGTILFQELDEINEVIFIETGECDIGYEINKQQKYVIRYTKSTVVGAFNCTFNKRAIFCYKANSECKGYSIRRSNWVQLVDEDEYPNISKILKKNVEYDYLTNIKNKVLDCKKKHILKYQKRSDYQQMLTIIPHDALTGDLNIIGGKIGFPIQGNDTTPTPGMFTQGMPPTATTMGEEDEETLRDQYTEKFEQSQEMVSTLLDSIDDKHQENLQLAIELEKIYREINVAKEAKAGSQPVAQVAEEADKAE